MDIQRKNILLVQGDRRIKNMVYLGPAGFSSSNGIPDRKAGIVGDQRDGVPALCIGHPVIDPDEFDRRNDLHAPPSKTGMNRFLGMGGGVSSDQEADRTDQDYSGGQVRSIGHLSMFIVLWFILSDRPSQGPFPPDHREEEVRPVQVDGHLRPRIGPEGEIPVGGEDHQSYLLAGRDDLVIGLKIESHLVELPWD